MTVSKERFRKGEEAFKPVKQEVDSHEDQIDEVLCTVLVTLLRNPQ